MRMIVPYEKEIIFGTKISEISSISLEYDANLIEGDLEGDFILEGEYKIHEISINKEPFKYRLPFTIELPDNILRDSIHYDIYNFTYEINGEDTLKLNIDFLVEGEEVEEKPVVEEVVVEEPVVEEKEPEREEVEIEEENNIVSNHADESIILNHVNDSMNTYIIYHVYVINETDDIDTVSKKYNVSKELIKEYNEPLNWVIGEKILIPEIKDE